ncbi:MAG: DUF378 domain-containing protein [bacterium]
MKALSMITFILLVVGGLNWLLVGLFNWDVGLLFGDAGNIVAKVIYVLVGVSAVVQIFTGKDCCKSPAGTQQM